MQAVRFSPCLCNVCSNCGSFWFLPVVFARLSPSPLHLLHPVCLFWRAASTVLSPHPTSPLHCASLLLLPHKGHPPAVVPATFWVSLIFLQNFGVGLEMSVFSCIPSICHYVSHRKCVGCTHRPNTVVCDFKFVHFRLVISPEDLTERKENGLKYWWHLTKHALFV